MIAGYMTVGELARQTRLSESVVRRVADSLGEEIPRVGQYRMIPISLVPTVAKLAKERVEKRYARRTAIA